MKFWVVNGLMIKPDGQLHTFAGTGYAETEEAILGLHLKELLKQNPTYTIKAIFASDVTQYVAEFAEQFLRN